MSYLPTPPVPDYPSTHTVEGAAAATVMARFFNTDFISFSMTSGAPYPGITRKFWSFSEAARENGASRVLCGIHFSTAVNAGYSQGACIGDWVFEHALRPASPPSASAASLVPEKAKTEEDISESLSSVTVSESESCDANRGSLEVVFSADSLLQSLTPELAR